MISIRWFLNRFWIVQEFPAGRILFRPRTGDPERGRQECKAWLRAKGYQLD